MAKALYICPDTRALAVRDRALVAGTTKDAPLCICGVVGCCAGGAEPCTLPAEDGPGGNLTIVGSSELTMEFSPIYGGCATVPDTTTVSFTGGTAPLTATACQCLATTFNGGIAPYGHIVHDTNEGNPFPGSGYSRLSRASVSSTRSGAAPLIPCGDDNTLWDLRFQHYQLLDKWNPAVCGGLDYQLTLEARIKVKMQPGQAACITDRTVFLRIHSYFNNTHPSGETFPTTVDQTIELDEATVSIVRDGSCALSIRIAGQFQATYPGAGEPLAIRSAFDLTFADGSLGCSHAQQPDNCIGACCKLGVCSQTTQAECVGDGGFFLGQGVPCDTLACGDGTPPPVCCDTACCRVSNLAPGGFVNINWNLQMEVHGRICCTSFNPARINTCQIQNHSNSGTAQVPYTSDCMNFVDSQVQGQKTINNFLLIPNNCCLPFPISNIFVNNNSVGFIASCNATSGPLFTFIIRLSGVGGPVVSFVSQSCNYIEFDETVSVFSQTCGISGNLVPFWLADIRFIGSAAIASRSRCSTGANRPDIVDSIGRPIDIPGITETRDAIYHGTRVPLRKLARGCASCRDSNKGAALI